MLIGKSVIMLISAVGILLIILMFFFGFYQIESNSTNSNKIEYSHLVISYVSFIYDIHYSNGSKVIEKINSCQNDKYSPCFGSIFTYMIMFLIFHIMSMLIFIVDFVFSFLRKSYNLQYTTKYRGSLFLFISFAILAFFILSCQFGSLFDFDNMALEQTIIEGESLTQMSASADTNFYLSFVVIILQIIKAIVYGLDFYRLKQRGMDDSEESELLE